MTGRVALAAQGGPRPEELLGAERHERVLVLRGQGMPETLLRRMLPARRLRRSKGRTGPGPGIGVAGPRPGRARHRLSVAGHRPGRAQPGLRGTVPCTGSNVPWTGNDPQDLVEERQVSAPRRAVELVTFLTGGRCHRDATRRSGERGASVSRTRAPSELHIRTSPFSSTSKACVYHLRKCSRTRRRDRCPKMYATAAEIHRRHCGQCGQMAGTGRIGYPVTWGRTDRMSQMTQRGLGRRRPGAAGHAGGCHGVPRSV